MRINTASLIFCLVLPLWACDRVAPKTTLDEAKLASEVKTADVKGVDNSLYDEAKKADSTGAYEKSAQLYRQLFDKDQNSDTYTLGFADALRKSGDYKPSMMYYDKVIASQPDNLDAKEGKALAMVMDGDFEKAKSILNEVIGKDSKRWRSVNALGIIAAVNNNTQGAIEYFRKASDINPNSPSVLNNIGLALAINRDYEGAVKALELASANTREGTNERKQADLNLSLVYGVSGQTDKAAMYARKHLKEAEVYNNLGYYAHLAKDPGLAASYLNMALVQSPVYYRKAWDNLDRIGDRR